MSSCNAQPKMSPVCGKAPEDRCPGCRRAIDFLSQPSGGSAPTMVRVIRPIPANRPMQAAPQVD